MLWDQMLGSKQQKCDVDEQLLIKHIKLLPCNVFDFTLTDDIAPEWITAGGNYCPISSHRLNNTFESKAALQAFCVG